jgi:hypothetical protein
LPFDNGRVALSQRPNAAVSARGKQGFSRRSTAWCALRAMGDGEILLDEAASKKINKYQEEIKLYRPI